MAKKYSELPSATAPFASSDIVSLVHAGVTKKFPVNGLGDLAGTTGTATISSGALNLSAVTSATVRVSLTANITSITLPAGQAGIRKDLVVEFTQDATGGRTVTGWGGVTVEGGGSIPPVSSAASSVTVYRLSNIDNSGWRMFVGGSGGSSGPTISSIIVACSDETTALAAGVNKVTFRMPYGFNLVEVRGSLSTAQTSGSLLTVDVNASGTSILSTKLTFDNTETTTKTAATPPVVATTFLADDTEMSVDIDAIGDGTAKGLKVALIGYPA